MPSDGWPPTILVILRLPQLTLAILLIFLAQQAHPRIKETPEEIVVETKTVVETKEESTEGIVVETKTVVKTEAKTVTATEGKTEEIVATENKTQNAFPRLQVLSLSPI